jgi:hypothetical protein
MRKTVLVAVGLMTAAGGAFAGEALSKADVEATLVGNTRSMSVRSSVTGTSGILYYYYAPDGFMHAKNTFSEDGRAKYSIDDEGKICITWERKVPNSLAGDGCTAVSREGETTISIGGRTWTIAKGDARP